MTVTVDASVWLDIAVNALLPAVVAFVTKQAAHPGLKAVVLLFLSALSGFLTTWSDTLDQHAAFDWSQAGMTALVGFAVAVLIHFGLWKPLSFTGSAGVVARRVPGGIGRHIDRGRHEAP